MIRRNIPGLSPDDVDEETGEARRIIYRWPHIYDPDGRMTRLLSQETAEIDSELPQALQISSANHSTNHVVH